MGQYYKPTVEKDGEVSVFYSHDYDNGLKLMEHSYIGNDFVNAVSTKILKSPGRVAWIGDYSNSGADEYGDDPYEKKLPYESFVKMYEKAWGEHEEYPHPAPAPILEDDCNGMYLVNHDIKCYIALEDYVKANKWTERGVWKDGKIDESETYDMCVHPLPLLTACGNGRGGGDYFAQYPDYEFIGTWAFDLLEITDEKPEEYTATMYTFTEQRLSVAAIDGRKELVSSLEGVKDKMNEILVFLESESGSYDMRLAVSTHCIGKDMQRLLENIDKAIAEAKKKLTAAEGKVVA